MKAGGEVAGVLHNVAGAGEKGVLAPTVQYHEPRGEDAIECDIGDTPREAIHQELGCHGILLL